MKHYFALLLVASLFTVACSSSRKTQSASGGTTSTSHKPGKYKMYNDNAFQLTGISEDTTYGYSEKNAIKVGAGSDPYKSGASNERMYLNGLLGPNGEAIMYTRRGSCCPTPSKYGMFGNALLDIYEIMYEGLKEPIVIYLNMYDPSTDLKAPKGFTFKK